MASGLGGGFGGGSNGSTGTSNVLNFEFVFKQLEELYTGLNKAWAFFTVPLSEGLAETLIEMGLNASLANNLENIVSKSYIGGLTPLALILGSAIPVLILLTTIQYTKSIVNIS